MVSVASDLAEMPLGCLDGLRFRDGTRPQTRQKTVDLLRDFWAHDNLKVLHLEDCGIVDLPPAYFTIPPINRRLERLYLCGNDLADLPRGLGQCTELETLDISECRLGELPPWLGALPRLQSICI